MVSQVGNASRGNRKYYSKFDFYPKSNYEKIEELSNKHVEIFDTNEGLMMNVKIAPNSLNNMLPMIKNKELNQAAQAHVNNQAEDQTSEKETEKSENKVSGTKKKRDVEEQIVDTIVNKKQKSATNSTFLNKRSYELTSNKRYSDLGGMSDILEEIKELVEFPLRHPEVFEYLGTTPPRGILL